MSPSTDSFWRFLTAVMVGAKRIRLMASTTTRFISSGIPLSKDLKPASTWASMVRVFEAAIAAPRVEFTSPTTTVASGRRSSRIASYCLITSAVWAPWVFASLPTDRKTEGSGRSRSSKNAFDIL